MFVREGMKRFRVTHSGAGFIWLGFPGREWPPAPALVDAWTEEERRSLLLPTSLIHDDFLTALARAACLRSPAGDGVRSYQQEALALNVPVVASENGRRPAGVIVYRDDDAVDRCTKMADVADNDWSIRSNQDGSRTGYDAPRARRQWRTG